MSAAADAAALLRAAAELVRRELGAVALGTYATEDFTDPRYGVFGDTRKYPQYPRCVQHGH